MNKKTVSNKMFTEQIIIISKWISKLVFLGLTCYLAFAYTVALSMKIEHPNFKNLPIGEFVIFGGIIIFLIFINLIIFGIWKTQKKSG